MSEAPVNDDEPNPRYTPERVGLDLHAGHIAFEIQQIIEATTQELNANALMIIKLLQYLAGTYYTDSQRQHAKSDLFRLRQERTALEERFQRCLNMAPELLEPVTANT